MPTHVLTSLWYSPTTTASAGIGFRFTTTSKSLAFLQLQPPAVTVRFEASKHISAYIHKNLPGWLTFATEECGFDLDDDRLLFVCGTTKTSSCITASYRGVSRDIEGCVTGGVGSLAQAHLSLKIGNEVDSSDRCQQRSAPALPWDQRGHSLAVTANDSQSIQTEAPKQCIFVNYFKMKRRLFKKIAMRAAAGPHELPDGSDDPESTSVLARDAPISPTDFEFEIEREYPEEFLKVS